MRFTVKDLRAEIADINESFENYGVSVRFIVAGRNGYQAVDEYPVWPDGSRRGTYVNRNICCGSARECARASRDEYYTIINKALENSLL